ncbi:threonine/serine dehydratase [Paeniglutamicibacter kerguelensis]|uniref:Threonine dehydratase n=1 Tax=Paeniglutamicibacter kerguelensis TaxID=254788 RepID=A0ABS4XAM0_9MICC|nr:threonine/serine dehydratase [Paeniglutamicibacter kerguelensis]MBP2385515.1 threonine dehydratase [Paeniglutamicibacter kerguelensis]
MLLLSDVLDASARIAGRVRTTPLMPVDDPGLPGVTHLKLEQLQLTGTFKARGAFNRQLAALEAGELDAEAGIVAASGGNAGLANAYAAAALGVPANVFVPGNAPAVKVAKLRAYGAVVHLVGTEYSHAYEAAIEFAQRRGALFCHAYDQAEIVAGAGSIGLEVIGQAAGGVDTLLVAVGGGGLVGGITAGVDRRIKIVGVEPELCPSLTDSLAAGHPVEVEVSGIAADSLGARLIGTIGFEVAAAHGVSTVTVTEQSILEARSWLWQNYRMAVEHGAATVVAAVRSGAYVPAPGERVALLVCGANTDPSDL